MKRMACCVGNAAFWCLLMLLSSAGAVAASASTADHSDGAQTIVHLLDYISVDYPAFVRDGQVLNPSEYAEQREFALQVRELLGGLPPSSNTPVLLDDAKRLEAQILARADGTEVIRIAGTLRSRVIQAYSLIVAPQMAPDLDLGAKLFQSHCSTCHGGAGRGDGIAARNMDPKPANFHNEPRMDAMSLYGLYNTITLGVGGTPMRPFTDLPESERWALAFYVGSLRYDPKSVARGEALWNQGKGRESFETLPALVTSTVAQLRADGGEAQVAVAAFLTTRPGVLTASAAAPLAITREKLASALSAYQAQDHERARQFAIAAYLEGFELIEASLDNVDTPLRQETERQMMQLRAAIGERQPVGSVADQVHQIEALLAQADAKLSGGNLSPATAFFSSLLILLREGLEAILVLAAIIAFVLKIGRLDALPYIHLGWAVALVLGLLTWLIAHHLLSISGANREMTEGLTALIAAGMLLYVGYWLHGKSYAHAWQSFIRDQVTAALGKRTLGAMAGISFLAVYRELFEIILFYEALWAQAGPGARHAVLGGILAAVVLLGLIGALILKYSVRLPIGPFFAVTSGLLALMAIVFAGSGVAALQEAGAVNATAVPFVSVPLLGIYPTLQGLLLQAIGLVLVLSGILMTHRANRRHAR